MKKNLKILLTLLIILIFTVSCTKKSILDSSIDNKEYISTSINGTSIENTTLESSDSSKTQNDLSNDLKQGKNNVETIYIYGISSEDSERANGQGEDAKTVIYTPQNGISDENEKENFIKTYLQSQGQYKEKPDGETLDNEGRPLVDYYFNKDKSKVSFILLNKMYCTTLTLDDSKIAGNLLTKYNEEQNTTYETLYDVNGRREASVSYQYLQSSPFPFLTKYWNISSEVDGLLCRNQKMWFYKDQANFDQSGNWIGNNKNNINIKDNMVYFRYPSNCFYNNNGKLNLITEELQPGDKYREEYGNSGEIKLNYQDDGKLSLIEYDRSDGIHGTNNMVGKIYYDSNGRMIKNDYYVTHGDPECVFLYDGDSKMPWACIYYNDFFPKFDSIYLFLPN